MKRGVELSVSAIVLIVLGLLVLAIVLYLVASNANRANKDLGSCTAKGGQCYDAGEPCPPGTQSIGTFFTKECDEGQRCCAPALS